MSERNTFTRQDIEELASALDTEPAPQRDLRKQEALELLAPQLKAARGRGHTLESLVEQLAARGLRTHSRAVRQAISRLDASKPARKRKSAETSC